MPTATSTPTLPASNGIWAVVPSQYQGMIVAAATKWGIDPNILAAVGNVESSYAPDVINGQRQSSTGAVGMFQFEPGTARQYGVKSTDPASSADGAAHYLHDLVQSTGSMSAALQAYSGNTPGYAAKVIGQANGNPPAADPNAATANPAFNPLGGAFDWVGQIFQPFLEFLIQAGMVIGGVVMILFGGKLIWDQVA